MICKRCKCEEVHSDGFKQTIKDECIIIHIKNKCKSCGSIWYTNRYYDFSSELEVGPPYFEIPQ